MATINGQGRYAHGVLDAGACLDNAQFAVGGIPVWFNPKTLIYRKGLLSDGLANLSAFDIDGLASTVISTKAPTVLFGSKLGHWVAYNPTDGIYSSPLVGFSMPPTGGLQLRGLAPDGAVAYTVSGVTRIRETNGNDFVLTPDFFHELALGMGGQAVWRTSAVLKTNLMPDMKVLGGVIAGPKLAIVGTEWWICYFSTTHGGVIHKLTNTQGFLVPGATNFDIELLEGTSKVRYVWSTTDEGEAGTMSYIDLDLAITAPNVGTGDEVVVPGVPPDPEVVGVPDAQGIVTLTSTVTFDVQPTPEVVETVELEIYPSYPLGKGRGRLIHPTLGSFDYEAKPDEWVNIDAEIVIPPIWASSRTLTSAANVLWKGNIRDVVVEERWKSLGGLAMPITQLRMMMAIWTTPIDPDVGYVVWLPSYITQARFRVIPVNLSVGGQGIVFDDVVNYRDEDGEPIGWVTAPVTLSLKIVERL